MVGKVGKLGPKWGGGSAATHTAAQRAATGRWSLRIHPMPHAVTMGASRESWRNPQLATKSASQLVLGCALPPDHPSDEHGRMSFVVGLDLKTDGPDPRARCCGCVADPHDDLTPCGIDCHNMESASREHKRAAPTMARASHAVPSQGKTLLWRESGGAEEDRQRCWPSGASAVGMYKLAEESLSSSSRCHPPQSDTAKGAPSTDGHRSTLARHATHLLRKPRNRDFRVGRLPVDGRRQRAVVAESSPSLLPYCAFLCGVAAHDFWCS